MLRSIVEEIPSPESMPHWGEMSHEVIRPDCSPVPLASSVPQGGGWLLRIAGLLFWGRLATSCDTGMDRRCHKLASSGIRRDIATLSPEGGPGSTDGTLDSVKVLWR